MGKELVDVEFRLTKEVMTRVRAIARLSGCAPATVIKVMLAIMCLEAEASPK